MLSLLSVVILSGSLYLSAISDLNSSNEIVERPSHNAVGLLDNYYKEFEPAAIHGANYKCASDHLKRTDLLNSYYFKFLK